MLIYRIRKEDWTSVGGPMGSEQTPTVWSSLHRNIIDAQNAAMLDNGKPINWKFDNDHWHSGDLGSHAYIITKEQVT